MAPIVPLRRVIRAVWILLAVATLSALPWMVVEFKRAKYSVHYQAWFIAGVFVILAVSASIYEVAMHLEYYNRPRLQLRVVRILWMVPIYAVDSWLSLRFKEARFYIDPIRECYEAFVIYQFFMYLVAYLEEEYGDICAYFMVKEQVKHLWPLDRFLAPWPMGERFFWETKRGVLSYVIARPLMTAVSVVANIAGVYGEGEFRRDRAYPYVAVVNNFTQMWALYCLVLLYQATHDELHPIRPLSKFVVIKLVVFVTYWQSVFIAICARLGLIRAAEWSTYDTDDVAAGLQNFLICIEMFMAAVAHAHAFPPRDYMDASRPPAGFMRNLRVMFDVRDVMQDVNVVVTGSVAETRDNLTEVGRRTWRTARDTVAAAPETLVGKPFRKLLGKGGEGSVGGSRRKGGEHDSDVDDEEGSHALLSYGGGGGGGGIGGGGCGSDGGKGGGGTRLACSESP
ncbi:transmembrane 184C [Micractinium conductrix]|uniref:Transmembrane 184C n=1 Tax=Micractinium conductrix TaxID=554055 RepID=A0A2P6V1V8_9CHLO|nr:transmembrane 184C [Micractinium conductrix]|eukprot:PSC68080.1 transmembrane 184C [Micractinium conductrix]